MRRSSTLLLAIAVFIGCDGVQRGEYAVTGHSSRAVTGTTGAFTVFRGGPQFAGASSETDQPLLYLLTVAPGLTVTGTTARASDERYLSFYTETWNVSGGPEVEIEITWNRRTEEVMVADRTFDRRRGEAFVVVREPSGELTVTQVGPIKEGTGDAGSLKQIQAGLPVESAAKRVQVAE